MFSFTYVYVFLIYIQHAGLIRDPLLKICMIIQVATIASWVGGVKPKFYVSIPKKRILSPHLPFPYIFGTKLPVASILDN